MKKSLYYSFISGIYEDVTKKKSDGVDEKTMALAIIEIFGNRDEITESDEKLCADAFLYHTFGDDEDDDKAKMEFLSKMDGFRNRAKSPTF